MTLKKSDDAISPVIGVMLMLVVTVVIAAAVTIFATGVVGETEAAPVAVLDVEILSNTASLPGLRGPELFITHISGDAVDTEDIELRFSWNCGLDGCTYGGAHYSTHSAEEMSKHYSNAVGGQPLYVKSTMSVQKEETKYMSGGLNHNFGDVILTPGLKLTAHSEFLPYTQENTNSPYMDVIFDNYKVSTDVTLKPEVACQTEAYFEGHAEQTYDPNCPYCTGYGYNEWGCYVGWIDQDMVNEYGIVEGDCARCAYSKPENHHPVSECTTDVNEKGQNICKCVKNTGKWSVDQTGNTGIMDHLKPGTAVDVMIVHIPSGKAIYDNTVIVQ